MDHSLEWNNYTDYFTILSVVIASTGIGTWLVALMHQPETHNTLPKQLYRIKASDLYEYEYIEEYDLLEDTKLTDDFISNLKQYTITEETPKGTVLMFYNDETKSFWYYFDGVTGVSSCPYKYLETVARAYILKYDCKQLLINYHQELINGKERLDRLKNMPILDDSAPQNPMGNKSLYASFKSYNRGLKTAKNTKKYYLITEKANRYSYKGKINDYNLVKYLTVSHKNIDFKAFKANMGSTDKIKTF